MGGREVAGEPSDAWAVIGPALCDVAVGHPEEA